MKQRCKGCFKANIIEYCVDCRRQLFSKARIQSILPFSVPERDQLSILSSYNKERTLQGIRIEYALQQNGNTLSLAAEKGSHILKVIPTGTFGRLGQLPANEHLTMQIAAQVYNIDVVPNALIFEENGQSAYITRRFELSQSRLYINKFTLQQLVGSDQYSIDNVEDIAGLLKKYIAAYKPQVEHLFSIAIFNYLFSNDSPAYYQLSLIETVEGEYILSPAYNLICSALHNSTQDISLYNGDYASPDFVRNGFYSYPDFIVLALRIGIVAKRAQRILTRFLENDLAVDYLITQSFLDEESRTAYTQLYHQRLEQLRMR